jgi:hypothetical protein
MIFNHSWKLLFFIGLALSFICAGCVPHATNDMGSTPSSSAVSSTGDADYPDGYYIHKVKFPDESISIIARWFTGDLKNWKVLAKCNPTINPNRIFRGNKIRIPRILMTRQEPLTLEFVEKAQPRPKRIKAKSPSRSQNTPLKTKTTPKPVEEEEPVLFGPKGYPGN